MDYLILELFAYVDSILTISRYKFYSVRKFYKLGLGNI